MPGLSIASKLARLPAEDRAEWVEQLDEDLLEEVARREWWFVARPEQLEPDGDWRIWLVQSGRGWGKTATGAEWLVQQMIDNPIDTAGKPTEWGAFGETFEDCRTLMVEGPSGLQNVLRRRGIRFRYVQHPRPRIWLATGQRIHFQGAQDGDVGRGLNLAGAWLDELAKWPKPSLSWAEGIAPALRVRTPSGRPRVIVTTTPKPVKLLADWSNRTDASVHVTRGSTFDNAANLSEDALAELLAQYGGPDGMSRIGRQELLGELLTDIEGALWRLAWIADGRVKEAPELAKIVVSIDPAVSDSEEADETGIVAVGRGVDGDDYVLADRSAKVVGAEAAKRAWQLWIDLEADEMIYESNQGDAWVRDVLRTAWDELKAEGLVNGNPPLRGVNARRGKRLRAEPVAARYEMSPTRVHHVGTHEKLELQMCEWLPSSGLSPDRLDALVHGLQALREGEQHDAALHSPLEAGSVPVGGLVPAGATVAPDLQAARRGPAQPLRRNRRWS